MPLPKTMSHVEPELLGGCHCGEVRYRVWGGIRHETNCHCTSCRRTSAAAFVSWFTTDKDCFAYSRGRATRYRSSDHGVREFCPSCGTQLTFASDRAPQEIDVTICSLDRPEVVVPKDDTWTDSALPWRPRSELLAFRTGRSQ